MKFAKISQTVSLNFELQLVYLLHFYLEKVQNKKNINKIKKETQFFREEAIANNYKVLKTKLTDLIK